MRENKITKTTKDTHFINEFFEFRSKKTYALGLPPNNILLSGKAS